MSLFFFFGGGGGMLGVALGLFIILGRVPMSLVNFALILYVKAFQTYPHFFHLTSPHGQSLSSTSAHYPTL